MSLEIIRTRDKVGLSHANVLTALRNFVKAQTGRSVVELHLNNDKVDLEKNRVYGAVAWLEDATVPAEAKSEPEDFNDPLKVALKGMLENLDELSPTLVEILQRVADIAALQITGVQHDVEARGLRIMAGRLARESETNPRLSPPETAPRGFDETGLR